MDAEFRPTLVTTVELTEPLPELRAVAPDGHGPYASALALIRLHGAPLGTLAVPLADASLPLSALADLIWTAFAVDINRHLADDDLPPAEALPVCGLPPAEAPRCRDPLESARAEAILVTVVVATRDRPDHVDRALQSLLAQRYPAFEILVVDNDPATDATEALVTGSFADPRVRYVREPKRGLSHARNRGIREARGALVAFLDDDAVADPDWLAAIAAAFAPGPAIWCVTGLVCPAALETPAQVLFEAYVGYGRGYAPRRYNLREDHPHEVTFPFSAGRFGTGANMAFRAAAFAITGLFDVALGAGTPTGGGEDLDLFFRVIAAGGTLAYAPRALVFHSHRPDYDGLVRQMRAFGVGFTAYMASVLLHQPRWVPYMAVRIPAGVRHFLRSKARQPDPARPVVPDELRRAEIGGMFAGPTAYVRSLCASKRESRRESGHGRMPARVR